MTSSYRPPTLIPTTLRPAGDDLIHAQGEGERHQCQRRLDLGISGVEAQYVLHLHGVAFLDLRQRSETHVEAVIIELLQ
jgi:hypothetical protein